VRFEPVFLPDEKRLNGRASQTFLRHYNGCPRSGYLYALYKGEASTVEMVRGSALHAVCERSTALAISNEWVTIPQEIVKDMVNVVLAEYPVPLEEHDYIREMAYRWATEYAAKPREVIAIESLIVLHVGGWDVRMKVDFAELLDDGERVHVVDYKSSRSMPTQEEIARKRTDPLPGGGEAAVLMAKNFQLVLYALGLAFGVPVRVEECTRCRGTGEPLNIYTPDEMIDPQGSILERDEETGAIRALCNMCGGSGRVETPEPFSLAGRAQRFDLEFVFPGIEWDGRMGRREMSLTRLELSEYMASLEALLANLDRSDETGDWPAQISDAACGECPASSLCPIPKELRDHRGTINTVEQAAEALEVLDRRRAEDAAIGREIKSFAKSRGEIDIRFGKDKVQEWKTSPVMKITDRDGLFAAVERAVRFGEPLDRDAYVQTKPSTGFKARTLTADELMAEAVEKGSIG
jgi:hypothetical protein